LENKGDLTFFYEEQMNQVRFTVSLSWHNLTPTV